MFSAFHNFTFVEHVNLVGILDGRQAVGDGNGGSGLHQPFQRLLYQPFAFGVEGGSRFIQYQDGRVFQNGPCDGDTLALSSGKAASPVTDVGVVPVFRFHDEVVGIGNLGRFYHLFLGRIVHSKRDVVIEAVVKQNGFLVHIADE